MAAEASAENTGAAMPRERRAAEAGFIELAGVVKVTGPIELSVRPPRSFYHITLW